MQHMNYIYLTLYRGFAGKGQYQAVLKHLGLTHKGTTVRVPNTFEYRATARKVRCNSKIIQLGGHSPHVKPHQWL
jgi:ribosomal protein L30/L7E